jgi:hypothetical protein
LSSSLPKSQPSRNEPGREIKRGIDPVIVI